MEWIKQETKSGDYSVKVFADSKIYFLHSRFNPKKEAKNLIENIEISNETRELIIIGIGAGYHVEQFIEKYPALSITVVEFNYIYAKWAIEQLDLVSKLVADGKITFLYSSNIYKLKNYLVEILSEKSIEIFIYKPSLELIEDFNLKLWFKQIRLFKKSFDSQKENMENNFNNNLVYQDNGISKFLKKYENKNFILVSAGPSLSKQLPKLKKMKNSKQFVIVCVGTAFKLLQQFGISPEFVMISDASDEITNQFNFEYGKGIPLFFLSTANHNTVVNYKGPKYIVWQEGYSYAEKWASIKNEPLIRTGGSVATGLLDLIITLGAKSVALVGQDLAFTEYQTHAKGIHSNNNVILKESLIIIDDFYRKDKVYTPLNLYTYKLWFEKYALSTKDKVELWNCTEGGAYIKNWQHVELEYYAYKHLL